MADLDNDLNLYEDIDCPLGTTLRWGFQLDPLDLTGTTTVFTLNGTPYTMTLTVSEAGTSDAVSQLTAEIAASVIASLGAGLWPYTIRTTYTDSSIGALGYGNVNIS